MLREKKLIPRHYKDMKKLLIFAGALVFGCACIGCSGLGGSNECGIDSDSVVVDSVDSLVPDTIITLDSTAVDSCF